MMIRRVPDKDQDMEMTMVREAMERRRPKMIGDLIKSLVNGMEPAKRMGVESQEERERENLMNYMANDKKTVEGSIRGMERQRVQDDLHHQDYLGALLDTGCTHTSMGVTKLKELKKHMGKKWSATLEYWDPRITTIKAYNGGREEVVATVILPLPKGMKRENLEVQVIKDQHLDDKDKILLTLSDRDLVDLGIVEYKVPYMRMGGTPFIPLWVDEEEEVAEIQTRMCKDGDEETPVLIQNDDEDAEDEKTKMEYRRIKQMVTQIMEEKLEQMASKEDQKMKIGKITKEDLQRLHSRAHKRGWDMTFKKLLHHAGLIERGEITKEMEEIRKGCKICNEKKGAPRQANVGTKMTNRILEEVQVDFIDWPLKPQIGAAAADKSKEKNKGKGGRHPDKGKKVDLRKPPKGKRPILHFVDIDTGYSIAFLMQNRKTEGILAAYQTLRGIEGKDPERLVCDDAPEFRGLVSRAEELGTEAAQVPHGTHPSHVEVHNRTLEQFLLIVEDELQEHGEHQDDNWILSEAS